MHLLAPFLLWAAHFAGLYGLTSIGCRSAWATRQWDGWPLLGLAGGVWTVAALGALLVATLVARRRLAGTPAGISALLASTLAALGIAWVAMPLVFLRPCT